MRSEVTIDGIKLTADQVKRAKMEADKPTFEFNTAVPTTGAYSTSTIATIVGKGSNGVEAPVQPRTAGNYANKGIYLPTNSGYPASWEIVKDNSGQLVAVPVENKDGRKEITIDGIKLTVDQVKRAWEELQKPEPPSFNFGIAKNGAIDGISNKGVAVRVEVRASGNYAGKGIYLQKNSPTWDSGLPSGWEIVTDSEGVQVAIPVENKITK